MSMASRSRTEIEVFLKGAAIGIAKVVQAR